MVPLVKLTNTGDDALSRVQDILSETGLYVSVSFDSHKMRDDASPVVCPHHGPSDCDCRVTILLVYDDDGQPATLLAHGQDGETWFSLATMPGPQPPAPLETKITQALLTWSP